MNIFHQAWEAIVRLRTWLVNGGGALLILLPELLNAPEVLAVIPTGYHKWVFVGVFLLNIAMRPRPASMPKDAESQVRKALSQSTSPTIVTVKEDGETTAVIHSAAKK